MSQWTIAVTEQRIRERIDALAPWFHTIDLGSGIQTQRDMAHGGDSNYPQHLWARVRRMLPVELSGMRVLDVGCNAGFFSTEMKRLGASYVLGIEAVPRYLEQAKLVRDALHLDIDLRELSVYEVAENLGTFDVTLFLGVLYHLKHPLLGLEKLAAVTKGTLIVESAIIPGSGPLTPGIRSYGGLAHELQFVENTPSVEAVLNWFVPSLDCLKAFLRVTGFGEIVSESVEDDRALVVARRSG
jgi:tRNA (mo5U34)-methyltransferase